MTTPLALDILAIAAHRDDVEQTCGGTLLSAEDRAREAAAAAKILKASWRSALDIPDARVENTWENRLKIAHVIRDQRPKVVILPYWQGRHPDHYTTSILGYEACFLVGLSKLDLPGAPHRPFKIVYATLYYDIRPTFVVDITEQFEQRLNSLYAYESQFTDQEAGSKDFPARAEIRGRIEAMARFYGMLAGVKYAEPFLQKEIGLVDDLTLIPVKSL
ncbi:MAG: bacillithiol biosynthesis deacetylase BshB1 [Acidobacteria bacterium]|nr:MAG: bacillithiol biosynthesis deacetylase BshB1 [Acidobacteriota bacterium]